MNPRFIACAFGFAAVGWLIGVAKGAVAAVAIACFVGLLA